LEKIHPLSGDDRVVGKGRQRREQAELKRVAFYIDVRWGSAEKILEKPGKLS